MENTDKILHSPLPYQDKNIPLNVKFNLCRKEVLFCKEQGIESISKIYEMEIHDQFKSGETRNFAYLVRGQWLY